MQLSRRYAEIGVWEARIDLMFVCNCNGIRARDMSVAIDAVVSTGAISADAVYRACGVTPKCGRCRVDIAKMLDAKLGEAQALAAE